MPCAPCAGTSVLLRMVAARLRLLEGSCRCDSVKVDLEGEDEGEDTTAGGMVMRE